MTDNISSNAINKAFENKVYTPYYEYDPIQLSDFALHERSRLFVELFEEFSANYISEPTGERNHRKSERNIEIYKALYVTGNISTFSEASIQFGIAQSNIREKSETISRRFFAKYGWQFLQFLPYGKTDIRYLAWGVTCNYELMKLFPGEITLNKYGKLEFGEFFKDKGINDLEIPERFKSFNYRLIDLMNGCLGIGEPVDGRFENQVPSFIEALKKFLNEFHEYKEA